MGLNIYLCPSRVSFFVSYILKSNRLTDLLPTGPLPRCFHSQGWARLKQGPAGSLVDSAAQDAC